MHIEVMRQAVTGLSKDVSGLLSSIFHDTFASSFIHIFHAEVNTNPFCVKNKADSKDDSVQL
jgi:hypothetical protein